MFKLILSLRSVLVPESFIVLDAKHTQALALDEGGRGDAPKITALNPHSTSAATRFEGHTLMRASSAGEERPVSVIGLTVALINGFAVLEGGLTR